MLSYKGLTTSLTLINIINIYILRGYIRPYKDINFSDEYSQGWQVGTPNFHAIAIQMTINQKEMKILIHEYQIFRLILEFRTRKLGHNPNR